MALGFALVLCWAAAQLGGAQLNGDESVAAGGGFEVDHEQRASLLEELGGEDQEGKEGAESEESEEGKEDGEEEDDEDDEREEEWDEERDEEDNGMPDDEPNALIDAGGGQSDQEETVKEEALSQGQAASKDEGGEDVADEVRNAEGESANIEEAKQALDKVYKEADLDKDGQVTKEELAKYMSNVHSEGERLWDLGSRIEQFDSDYDQLISLPEVLALHHHASRFRELENEKTNDVLETSVFQAADEDHDGLLNESEFATYYYPDLHSQKILEILARRDFLEADTDHDGVVTVKELGTLLGTEHSDVLMKAKDVDRNKDDKVTIEELEELESDKDNNEAAARRMIELADTDHDGRISITEFEAAGNSIMKSDVGYELSGFLGRQRNQDL